MLYDPKWYNPVYQGVALRDFISWLETMPPNEQYEYTFAAICAVAQYLQSKGASPAASIVNFGAAKPGDDGYWLNQIVNKRPYTFGAALERARAWSEPR